MVLQKPRCTCGGVCVRFSASARKLWVWTMVLSILTAIVLVEYQVGQQVGRDTLIFTILDDTNAFYNYNQQYQQYQHQHQNNISSQQLSFQFPSLDERVEYYMGRWYNLPNATTTTDKNKNMNNNDTVHQMDMEYLSRIPYLSMSNLPAVVHWKDRCHRAISPNAIRNAHGQWVPLWDLPLMMDLDGLQRANAANETPRDVFMPGTYWSDAVHILKLGPPGMKVLMAFGDEAIGRDVPLLIKSRLDGGNILAPLNMQRHYEESARLIESLSSIPWEDKNSTLIWRGSLTGVHRTRGSQRLNIVRRYFSDSTPDVDVGFVNNSLIRKAHQHVATHYLKPHVPVSELLSYKYLLSLEGNDVSSGLKWMLYAPDTVVFMPFPLEHRSWLMEERLVPFVHFIPLDATASDLPLKLAWARANDDKCRQISRQATQYMQDIYFSETGQANHRRVVQRLAQRYHELYGPLLNSLAPSSIV